MATLPELLTQVVELSGSDLHLSIGSPPQVRVHGELQKITGEPDLSASDISGFGWSNSREQGCTVLQPQPRRLTIPAIRD